ncbi:Outer membrane cobalamin translocator [Brevundimonas diminuta]|uniref:TonB-dependent receptor plug domain-containing protein n=1 Tax=Brevundimonas diminuta TaxID=293 RepID=UPI000207F50C|nr:TonB-dependent receptor [Brevundimonas diminuta]EGF95612.1 tonB-dependent Receptor Plug domain protein [Brevundimonas diminuta ATCC 11568]OWR19337.1 TonB-dependent receptor [Brevundimonas diminuta]WQE45580.1 TonB-dependent receptor [Brevundimonas diminuta]SPU44513.1 Outer membrane cobalamin translocator [Brevundimonas diminuta]SUW14792.1 Outer membrane cobalamin translocator [Brevundimonas diminuta]
MRTRKDYLLGTTMAAGAAALSMAMLIPGTALAQSASNTDQEATQVDEIVVVGSRIRRDNYNAPSPTQVVTREEATLQGFASTTEALQSTAVTGGSAQINNSYGGYVTNGGPGANTIGLRGMGPSRTLVLLNGRRVSPAGSRGSVGSADLNVLPTAMIDRVEVLRDGASSVYGSDAVAGVVNIQTRKNFEGLVFEAQRNEPLEANGAGGSTRLSLTAGARGDRWRAAGSIERYERDELTLRDREFTRCQTDGRRLGRDFIDPLTGESKCYPITSTGSNGSSINTIGVGVDGGLDDDGNRVFNGVAGTPAAGAPNVLFNRFRPNSGVTGDMAGYEGVGGTGVNVNVRDTFDDRMLNRSLISPVEITTIYGEGGYQLNALGNAEVYGEFLLNQRKSSQTGYRQLALDYAKGSPLIPSDLSFSTFSGDQGLNKGADIGVRAFIGFGNDTSTQEQRFNRNVVGIKGDFFIPEWRYDLAASYSKSRSEYTSQQFLTNRLIESLDVVPNGAGGFQCRELASNPGCVAAPKLSSQVIGGVLPKAWTDYVFRPVKGVTEYEEKIVSLGIDGPLFDLPAGKVMGFFGAEWRDAEIDDTPGLDSQLGNTYNYSTSAITRGSDSVWEVFGEIEAPLLRDQPFAKELTLNASFRYTDYDSYGDDTTYKVGLVYQPIDMLTFRATYGTSYRAPALFEQFVGATSGFQAAGFDPCSEVDPDSATPTLIANCAADGVSADFQQKSSVAVITKGGAEAGLEAETSTNLTVGLVLRPTLPEGWGDFAFAVDYYEIEVKNGVAQYGAANILERCYNSTPAEFAADVGFCSLVSRDAGDKRLTVENGYVNLATDIVKGLDYTARYRKDVGPGSVLFNLAVTQYTEISSKLFAEDPLQEYKGRLNNPEFTGTADLSYAWDKWRVRYGVEWVQGMDDYGYRRIKDPAASQYDLEVDDYYLHNASVQYTGEGWTVTAGVRNLLNEDPPTISSGYNNRVGNAPLYSGYDYLGRTAFVNLTKSF